MPRKINDELTVECKRLVAAGVLWTDPPPAPLYLYASCVSQERCSRNLGRKTLDLEYLLEWAFL